MSDFESPQTEGHAETEPGPRFRRASDVRDPSQHEQIVATLGEWVHHHPSPQFPALSFAEHGEYSPRQLYDAVKEKSEIGEFFEVLIVNGARLHPKGLKGVLQSFLEEAAVVPLREQDEHRKAEDSPKQSGRDPKRMKHHFNLDE